ncbi:MAG: patatin-like phospholipase family protein [Rhizobiales bacterium]|nr:patatin-like phospholipase family protein [Hyphomicrobiales bacterium]
MTEHRIGLALGGGSARGIAHITMLEAFDELGIKPHAIVGTSAGALVGAAYASGMSAAEIREHTLSLLGTRLHAAKHIWANRTRKLNSLFALRGFGSMQIDGAELVRLALPERVADRIEDTVIPFQIIATDFYGQSEVALSEGPMIEAVAASIAIPGVISAPEIGGRVLVDGGMANPVPFDKLPHTCTYKVAVDVTGRPVPRDGKHPSNMALAIGSLLTLFHQIAKLRRDQNPPDFYIEPAVDAFQAPDFFKAEAILRAAVPAKTELKRALEKLI